MATILIDDISLEIDLLAWANERLTNVKQRNSSWISACCPFHDDRSPSFALNADDGHYVCQACGSKGGFVKLVAHVEKSSMADAERGLIAKYARSVPSLYKPLELDFGRWDARRVEEVREIEGINVVPSLYLEGRGISIANQWRHGVGTTGQHDVIMPWYDAEGRRITHKIRSTTSKSFRYDTPIPSGQRRKTFFGVQLAGDAERVVVVEGEITAMSVAEVDEVGLAAGTSNISPEQIALLRRIPAKEIVVFHDDDAAGRKMLALIVKGVGASKVVTMVDWSLAPDVKDRDANGVLRECGPAKVREMIDKRVSAPLTLTFE